MKLGRFPEEGGNSRLVATQSAPSSVAQLGSAYKGVGAGHGHLDHFVLLLKSHSGRHGVVGVWMAPRRESVPHCQTPIQGWQLMPVLCGGCLLHLFAGSHGGASLSGCDLHLVGVHHAVQLLDGVG